MPTHHIQPDGIFAAPNYTHVVAVDSGRLVFISGQVSQDAAGNLVGGGDFAAQVRQVYENLKTCLAAGVTFRDVVKTNTYVVNYTPELRPVLTEVRASYMPAENPPASTLIGVQSLARPGFLIEIEAVAVIA
jgi:enamine deaminase RidA (YjgF/YER057c/UK114 family)